MYRIVGIYNYKKQETVNETILIKMQDTMIHRGPDGGNICI